MKATVLMADADAELCDLYQMFLGDYGFELETASDGLECLEKVRQIEPHAIILDAEIRWGGADGVLAWLRQERRLRPIPVILTTRSCYPPPELDDDRPPVVACFIKPFSADELLGCLCAAISCKSSDQRHYAKVGALYADGSIDDLEEQHYVSTCNTRSFSGPRAWHCGERQSSNERFP
jgi:DNA-binding response OmpR family regulator